MDIILNEKIYVESILESQYTGGKTTEILNRLAKYYSHYGYPKKKISELLEDFLVKRDPSINIFKLQGLIDKIASNAGKYELIQIDGVPITYKEIDMVKSIKGIRAQRVMFTLICLAKYNNLVNKKNNNWVNANDKDIFRLANTAVPNKTQSLILNDLFVDGYISFSHIIDNMNIRIENIDTEGKEVLFITDFRNLGNQYMKYLGGDYIECAECGLVVKVNKGVRGRPQKYCKDCYVIVNKSNALDRYYYRLNM